jgi:hypothetical protein
MLYPKLTDCSKCADISTLIAEIDCKIVELSQILYNNVVFILNKSFDYETMSDLLMYKRILMYKICNTNYAGEYTVNMIASKIKILKFK